MSSLTIFNQSDLALCLSRCIESSLERLQLNADHSQGRYRVHGPKAKVAQWSKFINRFASDKSPILGNLSMRRP